jgi:hypothetical protein
MIKAINGKENKFIDVPEVDVRHVMHNQEVLSDDCRFKLPFYWVKVKSNSSKLSGTSTNFKLFNNHELNRNLTDDSSKIVENEELINENSDED